nr:prepilin-type N-terminal cleavage/methylation domain-containing protein [uncultured Blautia sp.]
MKDRKRKNTNAGMTLIELIVAVSIFSIAAVVLLQSFVTSGRINSKSRLYLEATTMAQNLMEEIKSRKFEEVSLAFNYPIDSTTGDTRINFLNTQKNRIENGTLGIREVMRNTNDKGDTTYSDVSQYKDGVDESKVTASVISTDGGKTYKFNPRKKGKNASKYYFELTDVNADHESFDALVEFDGSTDSGYKEKTTADTGNGKNDYLPPNISDMNSKTNALLTEAKYPDKNYLTENLKKWLSSFDLDTEEGAALVDEIYDHSVKTLTLRIEENGGSVKIYADRELDPWDWIKANYSDRMDTSSTDFGKTIQTSGIMYSTETGEKMENIFLFYYPNYNSTSSASPLDRIILDNRINYEVNFYVSKQQDGQTHAQETLYRMSLTVKENPTARNKSNWNTNASLYRAVTKLRTNLDYDISDENEGAERLKTNQMSLTYQAVDNNGVDGIKAPGISAKKILSCNSLDDREAEDRIYTAKVSVYKAGAAEKNFPDSDLVVTLDGSKED